MDTNQLYIVHLKNYYSITKDVVDELLKRNSNTFRTKSFTISNTLIIDFSSKIEDKLVVSIILVVFLLYSLTLY